MITNLWRLSAEWRGSSEADTSLFTAAVTCQSAALYTQHLAVALHYSPLALTVQHTPVSPCSSAQHTHTHRHPPLSFKCTSGFQQQPSNWPRNPRAADKRNTSDRVTRVPECRLHLVNVRLEGPVHPKLTGHLFTPEHHVAVGPGQIPYYFLE